jgi:DNA-binding PadR family transcriptional regulator
LAQAVELGLVWHIKQSQLYALLARLEDAGYINAITESQGTRPPRKLLHLTASGKEAFETWLMTPVEHGRDFRLEFLAKLFFTTHESLGTAAALIRAQRATCQTWLADLRTQSIDIRDEHPYDWLVLQFRIGQIEAIIEWLGTCEASLIVEVAEG